MGTGIFGVPLNLSAKALLKSLAKHQTKLCNILGDICVITKPDNVSNVYNALMDNCIDLEKYIEHHNVEGT